jgi:hypothetical protein
VTAHVAGSCQFTVTSSTGPSSVTVQFNVSP